MRRRISGVLGAAGQAGGADGGGSGGPYADDVFSTYVYEGNGGTQTVENGVDLANEGGLVWVKNRTSGTVSDPHVLTDTERTKGGSGFYEFLSSNTADALNPAASGNITSFNENGFTTFGNASLNNKSGQDYVSWTFRKSPKFFDCITYTGTGVARDIPHNLGIEPGMVIIKSLDRTYKWIVSHRGLANLSEYLSLNETSAKSTDDKVFGSSSDSHTATTFHVGTDSYGNQIGDKYVAYVFAHDDSDESMIKCGSYIGAGSTEVDITLGWEPQWVMIKNATDTSGDAQPTRCAWNVIDVVRGWTADGIGNYVSANDSDAETKLATITPKANGFSVSSPNTGNSGDTYIYMAIRRPNKPAVEFEPEELFSALSDQPQSGGLFPHPHVTDFSFYKYMNGAQQWGVQDRMRGEKDLSFDSSAAEGGFVNGNKWDQMEGYSNVSPGAGNYFSWGFRRAPGYFDVVAYEGDGTDGRGIAHNLGVEPEMIWSKCRSVSNDWYVHVKGTTVKSNHLRLNTDQKIVNGNAFWDGHDEDQFFVQGMQTNWAGQSFINYLFASVPGISKVGSYTGQSGEVEVDCGFAGGASWVLIKTVNQTGDWLMTTPTSALNFTVALNTTDAMVGSYGLTPTANGFKANAGQALTNTPGAEYIFYAIA